VLFEEFKEFFEVDEAALESGRRRGYIGGDEFGKDDIAETLLVSEYVVCLFVSTEGRGSKFETLSMHGGDTVVCDTFSLFLASGGLGG
jgi:hypothetical protein